MGNGIFLGEALLPMDEVPLSEADSHLRDLPQIQLPLTKPTAYGDCHRNLKSRRILKLWKVKKTVGKKCSNFERPKKYILNTVHTFI
jgi:hypothetical protein